MKTTEWIALLSSIAALSAAVIALFTLLEMYRQRRSSYRPDLCLLKRTFELKSLEFGEEKLALEWKERTTDQNSILYYASLAVVNVGFGAAKSISCAWEFEYEYLLDKVNKLAQTTHSSFYVDASDQSLSINHKGEVTHLVMLHTEKDEFEYLLPMSQDSKGREIAIPAPYTMLISTYLSLMVRAGHSFKEIEIPLITLNLEYSDIGGGKHKTKHELAVKIGAIIGDKKDPKYSEFTLNILEK